MIQSRRHPFKFYGILGYLNIFMGTLSFFMFKLTLEEFHESGFVVMVFILSCFSLAFLFLLITCTYAYIKNCPKIEINHGSIKIGNRTILIDEIQRVYLVGKVPFKYLLTFPMEGFSIQLTNGETIYLFSDFYKNTPEIKETLHYLMNKKPFKMQPPILKAQLLEPIQYHRRSQLTSFTGLLMWGFIVSMLAMIFYYDKADRMNAYIAVSVAMVAFYLIFSMQMFHFGISPNALIIKNKNLPFLNRIIPLANIRKITIEHQPRGATGIRVTLLNYKNRTYASGPLREKDWNKFRSSLKKQGVKLK